MTVPLRHAAMQGGALVAARQAVSLAAGLGGTVALTALLGPGGYGRFAAALALYQYVFTVAPLGVNTWLVRRVPAAGEDPAQTSPDIAASIRTLLLLSSLGFGSIAALALPLLGSWLDAPDVRPLALAMLGALPLQLLNLVPLAALERALAYRAVARAELEGLLLYYAIAVALAWRGWGPEAIVLGWWIQQLWIGARVHLAARMLPRLRWSGDSAREALRFGLRYASSLWTYQLRDLVNPLIVGRWQGVEGVAVVALGVRLVEAASFVKTATWRLALPAFARLQQDAARLALAVRDGLRLQLLLVAPALLLLASVGVPVARRLFGPEWAALQLVIAPVAAATLCNAAFNLHSSALYAIGRAGEVWRFHVVYVTLFVGAALLLLPRVGLVGYGLAELVAIPSYVVVSRAYGRALGGQGVSLAQEALFAAGFATAILLAWRWPWAALVAVTMLLLPAQRAMLWQAVGALRHVVRGRAA